MTFDLPCAIRLIGIGQLSVLIASSLVPVRLNWKQQLAPLPPLLRQLYWVYGGYVVMAIIALGTVCLLHADELACGTGLARSVCVCGCVFWGIRLSLQCVLAAGPFLTTWWLRAGYHLLTLWFLSFVVVFGWAACQ